LTFFNDKIYETVDCEGRKPAGDDNFI